VALLQAAGIVLPPVPQPAGNYKPYEASDLVVDVLREKGKHARATVGAASLPVNSPVEVQAIFEVE
jgi:enamine deaminase RidA (YjgF/YER057c/UK114 family)